MAFFKKQSPEVPPDLAALQLRETELVVRQRALEAQHLDCEDIEQSERLLGEINDLNARIGVLRDQIEDFPR